MRAMPKRRLAPIGARRWSYVSLPPAPPAPPSEPPAGPPPETPADEPTPAAGQKYLFASPTGDDSRTRETCTEASPFKTIARLTAEAQPGDVQYARDGRYVERQINIAAKTGGTAAAPYWLLSYPVEWAILDGQHGGSGSYRPILASGSGSTITPVDYWNFRRLEITGGGVLGDPTIVNGAGIEIKGRHCTFRWLYLHDNYADTNSDGSAAGLMFKAGSQDNLVEYCWFKCNGNPVGDVNTGNANIALYADYRYDQVVDLAGATCRNVVRLCYLDANGDGGWTPVGVMHKGLQRLTGWAHGELAHVADLLPNDASCRAYGDRVYRNLFVGHAMMMRADQDYVQIYQNVGDISMAEAIAALEPALDAHDNFRAICTRDAYSTRRGSFWPCVYNNTVYCGGGQGITTPIQKDGWDCLVDGVTVDHDGAFAPGNILVAADDGYDWKALSVNSGSASNRTGVQPHTASKFDFSRNLLYNAEDPTNALHVEGSSGNLTIAAMVAGGWADELWSKVTADGSPFVGVSGADKFKTTGSYALGARTIANGGRGGDHPYLVGVAIPDHVGAIDPADAAWFDKVYSLASVAVLKAEGA